MKKKIKVNFGYIPSDLTTKQLIKLQKICERPNPFKVGDFITGNKYNEYCLTDKHSICKVKNIDVNNFNSIEVNLRYFTRYHGFRIHTEKADIDVIYLKGKNVEERFNNERYFVNSCLFRKLNKQELKKHFASLI